ncbi:hypothetical protein OK016_11175 [Vibrio chagasii]|nr:hypothetical protein [Vibrio chagasii]
MPLNPKPTQRLCRAPGWKGDVELAREDNRIAWKKFRYAAAVIKRCVAAWD